MPVDKMNHSIADGLPSCVPCDVDGFVWLKRKLGLNRRACKALLGSPFAKTRTSTLRAQLLRKKLRPGERDRLLLFQLYGDPSFRRDVWAKVFDQINSRDDDDLTSLMPSLEHRILTDYIHDYFDDEAETTYLDEGFSEWPDLVEHLMDDVPWADFAAYVWSNVRHRFNSTKPLNNEQQTDLTLVSFAVATIVDDDRILHAVIKASPKFSNEFGDIIDIEQDTDPVLIEDITLRWMELCNSLKFLSETAAGPPPRVDTLAKIKRVVDKLSAIEVQVNDHCVALQFDDVISCVNKFLNELNNDPRFSWMGDEEHATLRTMWRNIEGSTSLNKLRNELKRLNETVPILVAELRRLIVELTDAETDRDSLLEQIPSDLVTRHSWEERIDQIRTQAINLRSEKRRAEVRLLSQLSPFGETFQIGYTPAPNPLPHVRPSMSSTPLGTEDSRFQTEPDQEPPVSQTSDAKVVQRFEIPRNTTTADAPDGSKKKASPVQVSSSPSKKVEFRDEVAPEPTKPVVPMPPLKVQEPIHDCEPANDTPASGAMERTADALLNPTPRLAYAVQVARLMTRMSVTGDHPPAALFEAALLSDRLSEPDGELASELTKVLARFPSHRKLSDVDGRTGDIYAMMTFAGTLRPALLAPQSGAWGLLSDLRLTDELGVLNQFSNRIVTEIQALQNVRIDAIVLKAACSDSDWSYERARLCEDLKSWRAQARNTMLRYAPATKVWQQWMSPTGMISGLLKLVLTGSDDAQLTDMIDQLDTHKRFNELVKITDRKEIGRQGGQDIHAGALKQLYRRAQPAVAFARRHSSLNRSRPSPSNFLTQALTRLRDTVDRSGPRVSEELDALAGTGESLYAGAVNTVVYAIAQFRKLLHNELEHEPAVKELLASELFRFPAISINADGSVGGDPEEALNILLSNEPQTLKVSFNRRVDRRDFRTARRIVNWIETNDLDDTDDIRTRLNEALRLERRELRQDVDNARTRIEVAFARGHVSGHERDTHASNLAQIENRLEAQLIEFAEERTRIAEIADKIGNALNDQQSKARESLANLDIGPDSKEYMRIYDAIAQEDLITANELIGGILSNDPSSHLKQRREQRPFFKEFYPVQATKIDKAMESQTPAQVVDRVMSGKEFAGMAFSKVPGAQRNSAAQMLKAWFALKRVKRLGDSDHLTTLLSELGFIVRSVDVNSGSRNVGEALVNTDPIHAREDCPIPTFGSFAEGRYRIVCRWGRPTEEDIVRHADESGPRRATIVLYFGRLTRARRVRLGTLARESLKTLLVLDELLLIWLCGQRGSRLPILFACSVPFTYVQPYVTTAGSVPAEMFYGREQEMRDIADPNGHCFIYGGRQLGKTALLRASERTFHRPSDGHYAIWIDLKREGLGYDRVVAEIWPVIWRELREKLPETLMGIREPNPNIRRRVDDFIHFLSNKFRNSTGRKLLLLLDEADRFLAVDAREAVSNASVTGYLESTRLKGLMDQTERSIKVVFAGLHNVLRTVEYSNHPLGHFGQAIQVGPLWRSAEELIRQPLLTSGYQFEDENLVTRILAQTNYYPNLIQLYGTALVKAMCSRRLTDAPLYQIGDDVLDKIYQRNTNFGKEIRSKFHLTLQLDPRYEVIAYSLAHECENSDSVLGKGLDYRRIDEVSRNFWPRGFEDIEPYTDRFRSLLDEMTGLGVLRKIGDHRYTLRNSNVLMLMGTADEIDTQLLRDRVLPQDYESDLFRAHDPQNSDLPSRSPLTYQQENLLRKERNGVLIACGIRASGYDDLLRFVKAREASGSVIEVTKPASASELKEDLMSLFARRRVGTTIYVIRDSLSWSVDWINVALERVRALLRTDKNVRVLFMADPLRLYNCRNDLDGLTRNGVEWLPLRPWRKGFLHWWMDDVGFSNSQEMRNSVAKITGGWPVLLNRLYAMQQEAVDLEAALGSLDSQLDGGDEAEKMQQDFGLDGLEEQKRTLLRLAQLGDGDFSDLKEFAEEDGIDVETLRGTLRWAEQLHLVRREGQSTWKIDSVVARLLDPRSA